MDNQQNQEENIIEDDIKLDENINKEKGSNVEEIEDKEKQISTLDPTVKYYSTIVGKILDTVSERGYEFSNDNIAEIICKSLEVASYQKWQEIKFDNNDKKRVNSCGGLRL